MNSDDANFNQMSLSKRPLLAKTTFGFLFIIITTTTTATALVKLTAKIVVIIVYARARTCVPLLLLMLRQRRVGLVPLLPRVATTTRASSSLQQQQFCCVTASRERTRGRLFATARASTNTRYTPGLSVTSSSLAHLAARSCGGGGGGEAITR